LPGTHYGTVTNIEGKFSFSIPSSYSNDSIVFSYIGYKKEKIALPEIKNNVTVKLYPYINKLNDIEVAAKRPDAKEIFIKAYEKIPENLPEKPYTTYVFSRNFVRSDTAFLAYRKTITKVLTSYEGDVWWRKDLKGKIIADKFISDGKTKLGRYHTMLLPPSYVRRYRKKIGRKILRKVKAEIDTVIFTENSKIYVIDWYSKKLDSNTVSIMKKFVSGKDKNPYLLFFDTTVSSMSERYKYKSFYFRRVFIDAKNNYNIIKDKVFTSSNIDQFYYTVIEFSNDSSNSVIKHCVEYTYQKAISKYSFPHLYSVFEYFCYGQNFDDVDSSLYSCPGNIFEQYDGVFKGKEYTSFSFDRWNNHPQYIQTDSLEIKALKELMKANK
jgi:hypothetical protein